MHCFIYIELKKNYRNILYLLLLRCLGYSDYYFVVTALYLLKRNVCTLYAMYNIHSYTTYTIYVLFNENTTLVNDKKKPLLTTYDLPLTILT